MQLLVTYVKFKCKPTCSLYTFSTFVYSQRDFIDVLQGVRLVEYQTEPRKISTPDPGGSVTNCAYLMLLGVEHVASSSDESNTQDTTQSSQDYSQRLVILVVYFLRHFCFRFFNHLWQPMILILFASYACTVIFQRRRTIIICFNSVIRS